MTKRYTLIFLMALIHCLSIEAQNGLEGLWEGVLTGSIYSKVGYKFELYLKKDGKRWQGRATIYRDDAEPVEMNVYGSFYQDRSIYFRDIEFIPIEGSDFYPPFFRKYELIFERSIYESKLDGYWQEVGKSFEEHREKGRIFLRKVKDSNKA